MATIEEEAMNRISTFVKSLTFALAAAAFAVAAHAQALIEGEVVKVDKSLGKITLSHGAIKSVDLPPMKTAFHVQDKGVLDRYNPGDKVRFAVEKVGGYNTVTSIETLK